MELSTDDDIDSCVRQPISPLQMKLFWMNTCCNESSMSFIELRRFFNIQIKWKPILFVECFFFSFFCRCLYTYLYRKGTFTYAPSWDVTCFIMQTVKIILLKHLCVPVKWVGGDHTRHTYAGVDTNEQCIQIGMHASTKTQTHTGKVNKNSNCWKKRSAIR